MLVILILVKKTSLLRSQPPHLPTRKLLFYMCTSLVVEKSGSSVVLLPITTAYECQVVITYQNCMIAMAKYDVVDKQKHLTKNFI